MTGRRAGRWRAGWTGVAIAIVALTACGGSSDGVSFDSAAPTSAAVGGAPSAGGPTSENAPLTTATTAPSTSAVTSSPSTTKTTTPTAATQDAAGAPAGHFATLPVGATLPSEEYCAAHVRPANEVRPENAAFNARSGAGAPPQTGYFARVTGNFTGTTDEIIQWAACKWGIDEDIVRSQAAKESWWYQRTISDFSDDPTRCVPGHGIGVDGKDGQCPESSGLLQLRYPYIPDAFPMASDSTAYNVDYGLAYRRQCFEGLDSWFNDVDHGQTYAAGDIWGCVGAWFSGRWYLSGAVEYTEAVKGYYDSKVWSSGNFITG